MSVFQYTYKGLRIHTTLVLAYQHFHRLTNELVHIFWMTGRLGNFERYAGHHNTLDIMSIDTVMRNKRCSVAKTDPDVCYSTHHRVNLEAKFETNDTGIRRLIFATLQQNCKA